MTAQTPSTTLNPIPLTQSKKFNLWFFSLIIVLGILFAWLPILTTLTSQYINSSISQAGIAFGTARAINAIVSVIQTSTVNITFISIDLGQIFDPINDMVEDFSEVMKWALGSLLLQKVLFEIASREAFNWLLSVAGAITLSVIWLNAFSNQTKNYCVKFFLILFSIRFIVLFSLLLNSIAGSLLLDPAMAKNQEQLEINSNQMIELQKSLMGKNYQKQLDEIAVQLQNAQEAQQQLEQQHTQYQTDINTLNQNIKSKKSQLGWFKTDDELVTYQQKLTALSKQQRTLSIKIMNNNEHIKERQDQQNSLQSQLTGKASDDFGGNVLDTLSNAKSAASNIVSKKFWFQVENATKQLVDTMLQSMINFILKVILMPLLFLWITKKWLQSLFRRRLV